jgi:CHAT domain-containing protein
MPIKIKSIFCTVLCAVMLFLSGGSALADGISEWEYLRDEHQRLHQKMLYEKALVVGQKALVLIERIVGSEHPDTAESLNALGHTYRELAQHDKALPLGLRALKIREKVLGSDHPKTAQSINNLADIYSNLAQYDKALELQLRAFGIREKVLGSDHPDTAQSLNNLAVTYFNLAQYDKALAFQFRSLAVSEKVLGKDHPDTAFSLNNLAYIYGVLGQYEKALPRHIRALEIHEKVLGSDHPDTAASLAYLADTYINLAQYGNALPLNLRALKVHEKVLGSDHPKTGISLNNVALNYVHLAQYDKALKLQLRALEINEKTLGPNHPDTALSLSNLAYTYSKIAQHDKALSLDLRALEIREKVFGQDHPKIGLSLNNLALTYFNLAQFGKALSLQLRSLAIYEKALGSDHPGTAQSLNNLAQMYSKMSQYEKALPWHIQALDIREKVLGPDNPLTAESLNNLALVYVHLAQYGRALPLQMRTVVILEKVLGPDHPRTALSLNNLAYVHGKLGQHDKALKLQLRALAIAEKVLGPDHTGIALGLNNLAIIYSNLAQYDKALSFQLRALAIYEKVLGPDHSDTAMGLDNLGQHYVNLAQYEKALKLQFRALEIREKVLGSDHPDTAMSLQNLAFAFSETGNPSVAILFFKKAVNIYQSQREQISRIGASELQSYTGSISSTYRKLASLLSEQKRLPEAEQVLDMLEENELFDFIRRSRKDDPRKTKVGFTPTEQKWMVRYRKIADKLAALGAEDQALKKASKLGLTSKQRDRQKGLIADLVVAQKAFLYFVEEIRKGFVTKGVARVVEVSETSQQALQESQNLLKTLGNDTVQLRYYVTDNEVGMLLTTPSVHIARNSSIKAAELNRKIRQFRRLLRDPKSDPQPAAQALYHLLVAPVAKDLADAGAKTVMLSLDRELRYLPFGALHDGKQYLAQRWNLPIYTSVNKDKLRDTVTPKWQVAFMGVTQALGDFVALPAVKKEMEGITRVLPGEVYLDEKFSATSLKNVSQRKFQLLHVASHFQFSPRSENKSFLLLGDGQHLTLEDIQSQNYRFDNVDLLTLSACDTGMGGGRNESGKEIPGFGSIAQQQGAKAVLVTLWKVADQSTAELMAEMYQRRQEKNLTKIEALRQAQISLLSQAKYSHPFYWAPFVLMGNWK